MIPWLSFLFFTPLSSLSDSSFTFRSSPAPALRFGPLTLTQLYIAYLHYPPGVTGPLNKCLSQWNVSSPKARIYLSFLLLYHNLSFRTLLRVPTQCFYWKEKRKSNEIEWILYLTIILKIILVFIKLLGCSRLILSFSLNHNPGM
jgi:hypothetical protein